MATLTDKKTFTDIYLAVSTNEDPVFSFANDKASVPRDWLYVVLRVYDDPNNANPTQHLSLKYPGLSVDENAIYITGGMYDTNTGEFKHSMLWILDKR
jgi:hypothetical protein